MQEGSLCSTTSPAFIVSIFHDDGHSDQYEVIPHCSFDLHFSSELVILCIFSCVCWPIFCHLWRNICLGLLPIFWFRFLFFWYWIAWAVCIFWKLTLCLLLHFLISSPILRMNSLIRLNRISRTKYSGSISKWLFLYSSYPLIPIRNTRECFSNVHPENLVEVLETKVNRSTWSFPSPLKTLSLILIYTEFIEIFELHSKYSYHNWVHWQFLFLDSCSKWTLILCIYLSLQFSGQWFIL